VVNFIYDIPLLRHSQSRLVRSTVGGWQVSGIVTMESGTPINIGIRGGPGGNGLPNATNRPNLIGKISYPQTPVSGVQQGIQYIDPAAFSLPTAGAFGNLGHNALRGPGRDNWNLSLFKSFVFSETRGSKLEFRVETFNTFNHTQFNQVSNNIGFLPNGQIDTTTNFGRFTSAFDPRILQLGGKVYF